MHQDLAKVKLLLMIVVAMRDLHAIALRVLRLWVIPRHLHRKGMLACSLWTGRESWVSRHRHCVRQ